MTHPEGPINPEIRPDQEIETKIRDVDLKMLKVNLKLARAKLTTETRKISDKSFKNKKSQFCEGEILSAEVLNPESFRQLFEKLGYSVTLQNGKMLVKGQNSHPEVRVRIRQDGERYFITAKFKEADHKVAEERGIKQRTELEAEIRDNFNAEKLLRALGYTCAFEKEKHRTSYEIDYNGVKIKVEINEGPIARVRPWVEIEAPSEEYLVKTAQLLGFNKQDFFSGSDNDLYRRAGVSDEELKVIKFPSGKT